MKYSPGCDKSYYCKGINTGKSLWRADLEPVLLKTTQWSCPSFPNSLIPVLPGISLFWQHSCTTGSHQGIWCTPSFPQHLIIAEDSTSHFVFSCLFSSSVGISVQFCLSFSSPSQNLMKYCSSKNINPRRELFESPVPHLCCNWELLSFIYSFLISGHKQWESPQPITQAVFESNLPDTCISWVT